MALNYNPFQSIGGKDDFFENFWTDRSKNAYKDFLSGGWEKPKNWLNPGGVMANPAQQIADPGNFFTAQEHENWLGGKGVSDRTKMSALVAGLVYGGIAGGSALAGGGEAGGGQIGGAMGSSMEAQGGVAGAAGSNVGTGSVTTGSTGGNTMSNLLQNKLLMQYLSNVGSTTSQGGTTAQGLDEVTQQNITNQNYAAMNKRYAEMFKKMLDGDYSDGGSWSEDGKSATIKIPMSALTGEGETEVSPTGSNTQSKTSGDKRSTSYSNPLLSSDLDFSSADLAGLTPQMMAQALSGGKEIASVGYMSPAEIQDMAYKQKLMEQIDTSIASKNVQTPVEYFPVPVPGLGKVTMDQWKALPTDQQSYAAYVYQSNQLKPDEPVMSLSEWKKGTDKNTQLEYLKGLQEDPSLFKTAKELAQAGAMNLGERQAIKEMENEVENKDYFANPKSGFTKDVDTYISSEEVQNDLFQYEEKDRQKETIRKKEKFITSKITSSGGQITGARLDGHTFVWTVKWPDGTTSEVRYAN